MWDEDMKTTEFLFWKNSYKQTFYKQVRLLNT